MSDRSEIDPEQLSTWLIDLRRAHLYYDRGEPFFSGKDCRELAELIEQLNADAAKYRWLVENAGRWDCRPSPGLWRRPDGTEYQTHCHFSALDVSYSGRTLDEALTCVMSGDDGRPYRTKSC